MPLVTKLVDYEIRNDNLIDVYERLKFFAKECFKAGKEDFYRLKSILKEIDLYLKNYEYLNEDSDYDSDEEVFAITISKDIRQAIQEKLDLGSQLTEVERSLIAWNSTNSRERRDSLIVTPDIDKSKNVTIGKSVSFTTEELNKSNDNNSSNDGKDKSLYKQILMKGKIESSAQSVKKDESSPLWLQLTDSFKTDVNFDKDSVSSKEMNKLDEQKSRYERRFNTSSGYEPRSSSIQSIRSNRSAASSK